MATIVKIEWESSQESPRTIEHSRVSVRRWGRGYGINTYLSADEKILVTDLHNESIEFRQLTQILRVGGVKFLAIGNIDLVALHESCSNEISKKVNEINI